MLSLLVLLLNDVLVYRRWWRLLVQLLALLPEDFGSPVYLRTLV